jgi:hypothetical protein
MKEEKDNTHALSCFKCGAPLSQEDGGSLCMQCQVESAEDIIPDQKTIKPNVPSHLSGTWRYLRWALILICLAICVYFVMHNKKLFTGKPPIRNGSYRTDTVTDKCIQNLWGISALMQSQKSIPKELTCPASGKPYIVTEQEDMTIVSCPNPAKHKCSILEVNSKKMIPEVKK